VTRSSAAHLRRLRAPAAAPWAQLASCRYQATSVPPPADAAAPPPSGGAAAAAPPTGVVDAGAAGEADSAWSRRIFDYVTPPMPDLAAMDTQELSADVQRISDELPYAGSAAADDVLEKNADGSAAAAPLWEDCVTIEDIMDEEKYGSDAERRAADAAAAARRAGDDEDAGGGVMGGVAGEGDEELPDQNFGFAIPEDELDNHAKLAWRAFTIGTGLSLAGCATVVAGTMLACGFTSVGELFEYIRDKEARDVAALRAQGDDVKVVTLDLTDPKAFAAQLDEIWEIIREATVDDGKDGDGEDADADAAKAAAPAAVVA
jgi:hypothetical protein